MAFVGRALPFNGLSARLEGLIVNFRYLVRPVAVCALFLGGYVVRLFLEGRGSPSNAVGLVIETERVRLVDTPVVRRLGRARLVRKVAYVGGAIAFRRAFAVVLDLMNRSVLVVSVVGFVLATDSGFVRSGDDFVRFFLPWVDFARCDLYRLLNGAPYHFVVCALLFLRRS